MPYGEANVWWPVAEAVRAAVGLAPDVPHEVARDAVSAAVAAVVGGAGGAAVGAVAGAVAEVAQDSVAGVTLDDEQVERSELERVRAGPAAPAGHRGSAGAHRSATGPSRSPTGPCSCSSKPSPHQRPVVVILSDLHWADTSVLAMWTPRRPAGSCAVRSRRHGPSGAERPVDRTGGTSQPAGGEPGSTRPRRHRGAARPVGRGRSAHAR